MPDAPARPHVGASRSRSDVNASRSRGAALKAPFARLLAAAVVLARPAATSTTNTKPRAPVAPAYVGDWAVTSKRSTWGDQELMCLVVSDDPSVDGLYSVAHVDHPRYRVFEELEDPHGALGVWPAAHAACAVLETLAARLQRPPSVLELGCGAGLPALYASVVLRSPRVVATDVEAVPLEFLNAARRAHSPRSTSQSFFTNVLDVTGAAVDDVSGFDAIVAADMLYDTDVAAALGTLLGAAACGAQAPEFVVCDPGRRGRDHFLDAFSAASGRDARFVDQPVQNCVDVFDGTEVSTVGVLAAR